MAVLTDPQRIKVWRALMRRWSNERETCNFNKPELRAAVDALDNFMEANLSAVNNTLPSAFKTNATSGQKALLLAYVVLLRFGEDPREL